MVHCLHCLAADQLGPVKESSHCSLCQENLLFFHSEQAEQGLDLVQRGERDVYSVEVCEYVLDACDHV